MVENILVGILVFLAVAFVFCVGLLVGLIWWYKIENKISDDFIEDFVEVEKSNKKIIDTQDKIIKNQREIIEIHERINKNNDNFIEICKKHIDYMYDYVEALEVRLGIFKESRVRLSRGTQETEKQRTEESAENSVCTDIQD